MKHSNALLMEICAKTENMLESIDALEAKSVKGNTQEMITEMDCLRTSVDALEGLLPNHLWPLPSYAEMLFML